MFALFEDQSTTNLIIRKEAETRKKKSRIKPFSSKGRYKMQDFTYKESFEAKTLHSLRIA